MTQTEPLDAQEFTPRVDPFPGVFVANSSPEKAVPPTRPVGNPNYPPGSRYPVGLNAEFYLSSNDGGGSGVWDTAPKGCTATWCAKSNINWGPDRQSHRTDCGKYRHPAERDCDLSARHFEPATPDDGS